MILKTKTNYNAEYKSEYTSEDTHGYKAEYKADYKDEGKHEQNDADGQAAPLLLQHAPRLLATTPIKCPLQPPRGVPMPVPGPALATPDQPAPHRLKAPTASPDPWHTQSPALDS